MEDRNEELQQRDQTEKWVKSTLDVNCLEPALSTVQIRVQIRVQKPAKCRANRYV